jgi:hypothetical protein
VPLQSSGNTLELLARRQFNDLRDAEIKLVRNAPAGTPAICGPNDNDDDPLNNLSQAAGWDKQREIRADLIRWLCVHDEASRLVNSLGLQVYGAKLSLQLRNVTAPFPLTFEHCFVAQDIDLYASTLASLDMIGSSMRSMNASGATFKGDVFLKGVRVEGCLSFVSATIGGELALHGATLNNPARLGDHTDDAALLADFLNISGSVFLCHDEVSGKDFQAQGQVRMREARIGQDLCCDGGTFSNPELAGSDSSGSAIDLNNAVIQGIASFSTNFRSSGTVYLISVQITRFLACVSGSFSYPNRTARALAADGIVIHGDAKIVSSNFEGNLSMVGAHIDGQLNCERSHFHGAVWLQSATVGTLLWKQIDRSQDAGLDLSNVTTGSYEDDQPSWPKPGKLILDGFAYKLIDDSPLTLDARLDWLSRQLGFAAQPYRQLARYFSDNDRMDDSTAILVAMEHRQRRGQWTDPILHYTIGYGYHPLYSGWFLGASTLLGWFILRRAKISGTMCPTDQDAYKSFKGARGSPVYCPPLKPFIYSLENSLPLVKLGQVDHWQPDPERLKPDQPTATPPPVDSETSPYTLAHPAPHASKTALPGPPATDNWFKHQWRQLKQPAVRLQYFLWLQILFGWILATLFAAGVAGLIHTQ